MDTSDPGFATLYTDGTTSVLEFDASRAANIWRWQQNAGATLQLQMALDNNNTLTLYNQAASPTANITLNPLGTSTFQNSLTVNGTDNEMPNQALVNANSVLTRGLADGRYLVAGAGGATSLSFFSSSSATGTDSVALGQSSQASGLYAMTLGYLSQASGMNSIATGYETKALSTGATALGSGTTASGSYSTAFGGSSTASGFTSIAGGANAQASQSYAVALGSYTSASGFKSLALGYGTTASGYSSAAIGSFATASGKNADSFGCNSSASGYFATSMGFFTSASSYDSTAIGQHNVGGGTASSWVATDPLFEIGNGTSTQNSDALIVYKNGNASFQGVVTAAPTGDIPMYTGN